MWQNGMVEWVEGDTAFLSVVFSWQLQKAYQRAVWYKSEGYRVRAGGPAVTLNPDFLAGVAQIGGDVPALWRHNPDATFTSRGCVNRCPFCAVPMLEGALVELNDWPVRPIVCDNNLTACSLPHFDRVIDRLLEHNVSGVDFNQGLDARLLTEHHATRIAELYRAGLLAVVRLAWDHSNLEAQFRRAHGMLRDAGIPGRNIRVYCLIGFNDSPEDARHRLETVYGMGSLPSPMRYQPLHSTRRNEYVGGQQWSHRELTRYMRYYSNLMRCRAVPFDEFENRPNTASSATVPSASAAEAGLPERNRMYNQLFKNYFGAWNPERMPPKRCERVGCDALATVVAVAEHGNWYMCDRCASAPGVEVAVRLTPVASGECRRLRQR